MPKSRVLAFQKLNEYFYKLKKASLINLDIDFLFLSFVFGLNSVFTELTKQYIAVCLELKKVLITSRKLSKTSTD